MEARCYNLNFVPRSIKRSHTNLFTYLFLLMLLLSGCNSASQTDDTNHSSTIDKNVLKKVDHDLQILVNRNVFSGTVLLAQNGHILMNNAYGLADREQQIKNQPASRYLIRDLTQQFTAMSILLLESQGKLHLSDPMCNYIENCPDQWRPVTIEQLIGHSSGIPEIWEVADYDGVKNKQLTPQQLLDLFKDKKLNFEPGKSTYFTTSEYIILGMVIEKVSGQPYNAFVQQNLLDPLNLHDTGFRTNEQNANLAKGYSPDNSTFLADTSLDYASASMYSTTQDFQKWIQALLDGKVVSKAVDDELLKPHMDACETSSYCPWSGLKMAYGAWMEGVKGFGAEKNVLFSSGYSNTYTAQVVYYQQEKITLIIFANIGIYSYNSTMLTTIEADLFPDNNNS